MANRSMMLSPPLKNFHLSGDAQNRNKYSSVNQDIQTASTIARSGLSCGVPLWKCCNDGIVFSVKAIVDRTMKSIDITAIICKSIQEHFFFVFFSSYVVVVVGRIRFDEFIWLYISHGWARAGHPLLRANNASFTHNENWSSSEFVLFLISRDVISKFYQHHSKWTQHSVCWSVGATCIQSKPNQMNSSMTTW